MEAIRTKDKLFLAIVIPIAVVAAYFYLWRNDAAHRVTARTQECAALVTVEDFPFAREQAERQLKSAQTELEAERKIPMPTARVKADAAASIAARELAVLAVFRESGLSIVQGAQAEPKNPRGASVLKATGVRPAPACRTYELNGRYPDVLAALKTIVTREMAVIPEGVVMSKPDHWTLTLWL